MKNIITLILCLLLSVSPPLVKAQNCHAGTISALKDTVCQGGIVTLNVKGSSGNIEWQEATGDTFGIIAGEVDSIYRTVPLIQSTFFRVVVSNGSCADTSAIVTVFVPPPLTTYFTTTTGSNSVSFNLDSSKGNIARYHWDFGDGDTSNVADPSHSYVRDSFYYVCLTAFDSFGCSNTFCRYTEGGTYQCSADFSVSFMGDNTYFYPLGGPNIIDYTWTFGDDGSNSISHDVNPVHVYDSSGTYHVCLYIDADHNCSNLNCQSISVIISGVKPVSANHQSLIIYPNPCTDCEIRDLKNVNDVIVTDLVGRIVPVSFNKASDGYLLQLPGNRTGFFIVKNIKTGEVVKMIRE